MSNSLNVVLFGESGAGKNSVINMIAEKQVADIPSYVAMCSLSLKSYPLLVGGRIVRIWNMFGLDGPTIEGYFIKQACELIYQLSSYGGVDLLLLCMSGSWVSANSQTNYRLFHEAICMSLVPIAFVITHLEREADMENWWERNVEQLEKSGLRAAGHACVTGLPTHSKYRESQENITRLLQSYKSGNRFNMPFEAWLMESLSLFGPIAPIRNGVIKDIRKALAERYKMDLMVAWRVVESLANGPDPNRPSANSLNIILFGQTGSGKSSVINLIAGRKIAETSNGAAGCTLSYERYAFPVNGKPYHIWDTVGLDDPEMELDAIEEACDLIQNLEKQGGVDLLLFCIRAPRITSTSQANYRLFYEVLCRSRVPVAFVITHLEREIDMEGWWERNVERLEKFGLKAASHACITGIPAHSKFRKSQENITRLLQGHNSEGRFNMPSDAFLVKSLRLIGLFASLKKDSKQKEITQVLIKRCRMDPTKAEKIAQKIEDQKLG